LLSSAAPQSSCVAPRTVRCASHCPSLPACPGLLHGWQQSHRGCLTVASRLPYSSASTDHGLVIVVCP
jgi:hypothetical protein